MNQKLHLIYISGLGDKQPDSQRLAISSWYWWGITAELFQVDWGDKQPWPPKLHRLLDSIDAVLASGQAVALVGASAGASATINAYAARKAVLTGVVCIAGKINYPEAIDKRHLIENPAFITSVNDCQTALASLDDSDRQRILSRYAIKDDLVPKRDSFIPGAHNRTVPSIGHVITIATQITFGVPGFVRFLKQLKHQKSTD